MHSKCIHPSIFYLCLIQLSGCGGAGAYPSGAPGQVTSPSQATQRQTRQTLLRTLESPVDLTACCWTVRGTRREPTHSRGEHADLKASKMQFTQIKFGTCWEVGSIQSVMKSSFKKCCSTTYLHFWHLISLELLSHLCNSVSSPVDVLLSETRLDYRKWLNVCQHYSDWANITHICKSFPSI